MMLQYFHSGHAGFGGTDWVTDSGGGGLLGTAPGGEGVVGV